MSERTMTAKWFSTAELAERYGVSLKTVYDWRLRGVGPEAVRFGRHVRYSDLAVAEWERRQALQTTQHVS